MDATTQIVKNLTNEVELLVSRQILELLNEFPVELVKAHLEEKIKDYKPKWESKP